MTGALRGGTGLLVCLLTVSSCDRGTAPDITTASATAGSSSDAPHGNAPQEPYTAEEFPDEADFAAAAEREITKDNYRAKLAEIQRASSDRADGGADGSGLGDSSPGGGSPDPVDSAAAPTPSSTDREPPRSATP